MAKVTHETISGEELYELAITAVMDNDNPSISFIQRHFGIGYNLAADLIERMESEGIVSHPVKGKRQILVPEYVVKKETMSAPTERSVKLKKISENAQKASLVRKNNEEKVFGLTNSGFWAVVGFIILSVSIFKCSASPQEDNTREYESKYITQCQDAIRGQMKYSSKAKFSWITNNTWSDDKTVLIIRGDVEGMNSFGAMIPSTYKCVYEISTGDISSGYLEEARISER